MRASGVTAPFYARSLLPRRPVVEALERRTLFTAGDLDANFGPELFGRVVTHVSDRDSLAYAAAVLPDGKVIVAGRGASAGPGAADEFIAVRYNPDGTLDRTFGGADGFASGVAGAKFGIQGGQANELALLPGGKFLLAGSVGGFQGMALARFNADGTLDPSFAPGGDDGDGVATVRFRPGLGVGGAGAMAVQPDGKIVLGGSTALGIEHYEIAAARFSADGHLDPSFGPDGTGVLVTPVLRRGTTGIPFVFAMAALPGGKILAAGTSGPDIVLLRYLADGRLDPSFGRGGEDGDGVVETDFGRDEVANDMAVLPDGRILIAGGSGRGAGGQEQAVVVRYLSDGQLDGTFAGGGRLAFDPRVYLPFGDLARFTGLAVQRDGKILAGGDFFDGQGPSSDMLLVRLTPSGELDPAFGHPGADLPPGAVRTNFDNRSQEQVNGLALGQNGRVFLVGYTFTGAGSPPVDFAVAAYETDLEPEGTVRYQAELAWLAGPRIGVGDHPGYTGPGYVDYQHATGDFIEFIVDAPSAGRYELEFRYANGGSTPRPVALRVGEAEVHGGVRFAPTGSWRKWNSEVITVALPAGSNKVRLTAAGRSGPNLDVLRVRAAPPPTGTTYQAESQALSGAAAASDHPGFTGTGFADYKHASGDSVTFAVDFPAAGNYDLGFRYANGGAFTRPVGLRVDGALVAMIDFTPTGSWQTWNTVTQSLLLAPGRHTLVLTAAGKSGPNLDALTIVHPATPGI
jgi:uncharacterized delta-60 repeat protein